MAASFVSRVVTVAPRKLVGARSLRMAPRATPSVFVETDDPEISAYQKHQSQAVRISVAEEVKTIIQNNSSATVCTNASGNDTKGFPFAATMPYAVDDRGRFVASLSSLSSHARDLRQDSRCSIFVTDTAMEGMDDARCCVTGRLTEITDAAESQACKAVYRQRHPDHFWTDFGDFAMFRMDEVVTVRFVGGFGRIASLKPEEYWEAKPDPVAHFSSAVCSHMNQDHGESTLAMIKHYVGMTVDSARMLSIDRLGINIQAKRNDEEFKIRLPYDTPVEDRKSVKDRIVEMTKNAERAA